MKKNILLLLMAAGTLMYTGCSNTPESDEAKTTGEKEVTANTGGALKVNTAESKFEWVASKVSSAHSGVTPIKAGELFVKDGELTGGKITMDMTGILVTGPAGSKPEGNTKLTGHLKSADFFDAAKFPEAVFEITAVKPFTGTVTDEADPRQEDISEYKVANPTHTISGNLTIKGVTKNIEFPAKLTVAENTVDGVAKFNIDRRLWNITYPGAPDDLIRDMIHIGISIKAGS